VSSHLGWCRGVSVGVRAFGVAGLRFGSPTSICTTTMSSVSAGEPDGQLATAMLSTSSESGRATRVMVVASVWTVRVKCPTVRMRTDSDSMV
jgi:hypothetical protein